ncbi:MAG TPA: monofunctional biosynthetic peptidoglycan transglycosylase [Verrucomicrobiae bacterium]|nr:monofunctional biosynthetic peptidoglycan transglycosylase [Verrucomicrobiae bacterium]
MKIWNQRTRKWRNRILIGGVMFLFIPVLQVIGIRWINPPKTAPMCFRWVGGKFGSGAYKPNEHYWISLKSVPDGFVLAVWQTEDRHFFEHWGFDWEEIQKAREEARTTGKPPRGASTITQQCARSLFLWQGRSWIRKGFETYYTLLMELLLSKQRILELYVNAIELGDGVYGVEAGAQHYFHIAASQLTREQAALLVAVMPNPKVWDPNNPNERVLSRQAVILERSHNVKLPIKINE